MRSETMWRYVLQAYPRQKARKRAGRRKRAAPSLPVLLSKQSEMTWRDHLIMLLQVAAEIEHALMVQYLYAAYSIGGDQVPEKHRPKVEGWRNSLLATAREEMGHLLTVQNLLCLVGGAINLDREDFPWDVKFMPFPYVLEPFSFESISCYLYAEMPDKEAIRRAIPKAPMDVARSYQCFICSDLRRITRAVKRRTHDPHQVGVIYREIITLIHNETLIPDFEFQGETYAVQASSDDWGRGYQPEPRLVNADGAIIGKRLSEDYRGYKPSEREAHVIIDKVATRTQAIAALEAISGQGEGQQLGRKDEPSHFNRFLQIYQEYDAVRREPWSPSRPVPYNPTTQRAVAEHNKSDPTMRRIVPGDKSGYIQAEDSQRWANLFNVRYRMLLTYLAHTFRLSRETDSNEPSARAAVMHRVFGEMYNLKTVARVLVRLPLEDPETAERAAPPFEMPYSVRLPPDEPDCWRLYQDMLETSREISRILLRGDSLSEERRRYLQTLVDADNQAGEWIRTVLTDLVADERHHL